MASKNELYTFVAGNAYNSTETLVIKCNCGGTIKLLPPRQEDKAICPKCESIIHFIILEGNPGYVPVITNGVMDIALVQGSGSSSLTKAEKDEIISKLPKKDDTK